MRGKTAVYPVRMQLPGTFNVYNALAAIKAAGHLGAAESDICLALRSAKVPGRCENVKRSEDYVILIDYAHNEMSLKNLLEMLRGFKPRRLIVPVSYTHLDVYKRQLCDNLRGDRIT